MESAIDTIFCSSNGNGFNDKLPSNDKPVLGEPLAIQKIKLMEDIEKLVSDKSETCGSSSSILFGELKIKLDELNCCMFGLFQGYNKCIKDLKLMELEICKLTDCKLVMSDVT